MASRVWNESSCTNARILDAQVIGYEVAKRRWPVRKVYEFIIDVSWSYGGRTVTRRAYDDFLDLQTSILDRFPDEARPATRIIPCLPGRKLLTPNSKKLADQRIPDLDDYVKRLIQLPQRISESDIVLTFFEPDHADDPTDESTILPAANREWMEGKSTESEQGDSKGSKKRSSQTKKGSRKGGSGRKDGFINHVDDDDDDDDDDEDDGREVHLNDATLEKEDGKTSKKPPSRTRKGPRRNSSRKDGFMNYENEDDTDDVDDDSDGDDVYNYLAPRDALTKWELKV